MRGQSAEELIHTLNLPVIEINTVDGEEPTFRDTTYNKLHTIVGNEYVKGEMNIHLSKELLYESGEYHKNLGGMKLKVRGNTSVFSVQKPYKIKLETETDLMGTLTGAPCFPETEYLLLHPLFTTVVGFSLSRLVGKEWTPRYTYVNVVLNGHYKGLYLFVESVKKSEGRVNIMNDGFIIEYDAYWWKEKYWFETPIKSHAGHGAYTFKYPAEKELTEEKVKSVKEYVEELEKKIFDPHTDQMLYVDYESFAKWELIHDLLGNSDSWGSNIYLYRERFNEHAPFEEKIKIGPAWDFDAIFQVKSDSWTPIHKVYYFGGYGSNAGLNYRRTFNKEYWKIYLEKKTEVQNLVQTIKKDLAPYENSINTSVSLTWQTNQCVYQKMLEWEYENAETWFDRRITWMDQKQMEKYDVSEIQICAENVRKRGNEPFEVYIIKKTEEKEFGDMRVDVMNMDGTVVRTIKTNRSTFTVSLPSGVYYMTLYVSQQKRATCWVMVN